MSPNVVVTGGAGFIGSHVVDKLIESGYVVTVIDDLSTGNAANVNALARFHELSILDGSLDRVLSEARPGVVVHLAARVDAAASAEDPFEDAQTNVLGTLRLLEACCRAGVRHIVHTSSAAVYGDPQSLPITENHDHQPRSPYGLHKDLVGRYLDLYRRERDITYSNLHLANVYGPRQRAVGEGAVIPTFMKRILRGEPMLVHGDGNQTRDFVYVSDVVDAILRAMERPINCSVNISTGQATSILKLADVLRDIACLPVQLQHTSPRPGDITHSVLDNRRARQLLGWSPLMELRTGLLQTIAHMVSNMELEGFRRQAIMGALDQLEQGLAAAAAAGEDSARPSAN